MPGASNLIIIGAGGHALSVADAALSSGWTVVGFVSPDGEGPASTYGQVFSSVESINLSGTALALGIGTNHSRELAARDIANRYPQIEIATVVHKTAFISTHARVLPGAVVLAHAAVGPGSSVGPGALLNTGASLDHESSLADFASLGPGARTGGNVFVGERTMVGMQAGILHGIRVGSDSVVGAHSLINADVENNIVAWGTPAKKIRTRFKDDPYY